MSEDEAKAIAAKRETHKPKALHGLKKWKAVQDESGDWRPALVDDHAALLEAEYSKAKQAFLSGDENELVTSAGNYLMMRIHAEFRKDQP